MKTIFKILVLGTLLTSCNPQNPTPVPIPPNSCMIGKWSTLGGNTLNVKMSSEFEGDFANGDMVNGLNPIEQVANEWNTAIPGKSFFQVPFNIAATTGYATIPEFKDGEFGIYKSHTWFPNMSAQILAITQFYGTIKNSPTLGNFVDLNHADIIVNYKDFGANLSMHLPVATGFYDLPTIVIHEMGHFLGLCHDTTHDSIMQPIYNFNQRLLKPYDKTIINDLYVNDKLPASMNKDAAMAASIPVGTRVRGVIELHANGKCKHFIDGKLVYEH